MFRTRQKVTKKCPVGSGARDKCQKSVKKRLRDTFWTLFQDFSDTFSQHRENPDTSPDTPPRHFFDTFCIFQDMAPLAPDRHHNSCLSLCPPPRQSTSISTDRSPDTPPRHLFDTFCVLQDMAPLAPDRHHNTRPRAQPQPSNWPENRDQRPYLEALNHRVQRWAVRRRHPWPRHCPRRNPKTMTPVQSDPQQRKSGQQLGPEKGSETSKFDLPRPKDQFKR